MLKEIIIDIQKKYTLAQQLTAIITGLTALFVFLLLVLVSTFAAQFESSHIKELADNTGKQVSYQATEFILTKDLISLSVLCSQALESKTIAAVKILDAHHDTLAKAGRFPGHKGSIFIYPVRFNPVETIGYIHIAVDGNGQASDLAQIILYCTLLGLGFFLVIGFSTYWINRFHHESPLLAPASAPISNCVEASAEETLLSEAVASPLLVIQISNYESISSRIALSIVDSLYQQYTELIDSAALFYGGSVSTHEKHRLSVEFPADPTGKSYFDAACCASLFLGLQKGFNLQRSSKDKISFDFHLALLNTHNHKQVKWQLCQHSPINQLLVCTEDISENDLVRKLLPDSSPATIIETEQGAINTLALNRLDTQYQNLIDNQIHSLGY